MNADLWAFRLSISAAQSGVPTPYTDPNPRSPTFFQFFDFDNTYLTKGLYTQLQSTIYDRFHLLAGVRLQVDRYRLSRKFAFSPGVFSRPSATTTKALPRIGSVFDVLKDFRSMRATGRG